MRHNLKSSLLGVLCATTALSALPPEALAMSVAPPQTVALTSPTTDVHFYRRYYRWGYRPYHRHWGYHRHYRPYGYYGYYRPYYRRYYYYPGYSYYNPGGALFAGAALGLMGAGLAAATAPRWGWGWGGGWGPGWGYAGWGPGWGGGWW
jgi:hypothetical protein